MSQTDASPRVLVYTREDCHLCVAALEVVERVCAATGQSWASVGVDGDADLEQRYGHYVPAVLVDGVQQAFWRVDENRLTRLLSEPAG